MGSQTTVLQRLRRLLARRNSDSGMEPVTAAQISKDSAITEDASSRTSEQSATSDEVRDLASVIAVRQPSIPTTLGPADSLASLDSRRRMSYGSLSSRDLAHSAAPPDHDEVRDLASPVPNGSVPTPMAAGPVVRMDPKVYLLRNKPNDAASILTIASSSKKRRRRSLDTNASTRALAAESVFSSDAGSIASTQA